MKNLVKCGDAIHQDVNITHSLRNGYFASPNQVSKTEEDLLDLAASGICDDMFFMAVFKVGENMFVARYFEHGHLKGIQSICHEKIKDEFKIENVIMYKVFTGEDVLTENKRKSKLCLSKKKGIFD